MVADVAYKATPISKSLKTLCEQYQIELLRHQGFELPVVEAIANFRGEEMPLIATQIAIGNKINVALLAEVEKQLFKEIKKKETLNYKLQQLKYLWHTLVQFGKPVNND